MVTIKDATGGEAEEKISTLFVTRGSQCNCPGGARGHRVVMFFVCLYVAAEFELTMFRAIKLGAHNNCTWA